MAPRLPDWSEWTGKHITAFRAVTGLTRRELADLIDGSERSLYRWEHNEVAPRPMGLRAIHRIAGERLDADAVGRFLQALRD